MARNVFLNGILLALFVPTAAASLDDVRSRLSDKVVEGEENRELWGLFDFGDGNDVAECGGCYCIPDEGGSCPTAMMPQVDFPESLLDNLRGMEHENPLSLDCSPYTDSSCDTEPPLETGGACVAEIIPGGASCPEDYTYRLKTVASRSEAEQNGELVTHEGPCGLCSSFQDLAVFLETPDLASLGINCGALALFNFELGVNCYMNNGFSEACAKIFIYNTQNTNANCPQCWIKAIFGLPNNKQPPDCELASCLQCDEDSSGPLFKEFSGRTRRNSGLLSAIVRPCSSIPQLTQIDPCDSN